MTVPTIHRGHRIQTRAFRGLCIIDRTGAVLYEDCGSVEAARAMIDLLLVREWVPPTFEGRQEESPRGEARDVPSLEC